MIEVEQLYFWLRLFPQLCTLEDLDVPAPCYHNFLRNPNAVIHQHSISMAWCHVLPSMKKGKIVSISHELPDYGIFKSYKEIKRHWKNHYGYRLPEDEDNMLYYQVNFRPLGEKLFTYPEICLRARDIQKVPRIDPKPVLVVFLQDLQKKMPRICGFPLKLHNKACYPSIDLYEVTEVEKQTTQNLTSKPPNKKIIYRNTDDIQKLVTRNINNFTNNCHQSSDLIVAQKYLCSEKSQNQAHPDLPILEDAKIRCTTDANINDLHVNATLMRNYNNRSNIEGPKLVTDSNQTDLSVDFGHPKPLNSRPILKFDEGNIQHNSIVYKIIPVFKSKDRPSDKLLQMLPTESNEKAQRVVPVFKTRTLKTPIVYPNKKTFMETSQLPRGQDSCQNKGTPQTTTGFPYFNTSRNPNISKKPNFKSALQRPEILNLKTRQNKVLASPRVNSKKSSTKAQSVEKDLNAAVNSIPNINRTLKIPVPPIQSAHSSKSHQTTPVSTPLLHKGVLSQSPFQNVKNTPVIIPSTPKGNEYSLIAMSPASTTQCFQRQVENMSGLSSTPSTPGIKRHCPASISNVCEFSHEGTPVMKRPKPKQQVQDVNLEILARSNQLNKVNTVTLVSWLKDKGVVCKSRDKKGDLVEKTLQLLNLTVSEQ